MNSMNEVCRQRPMWFVRVLIQNMCRDAVAKIKIFLCKYFFDFTKYKRSIMSVKAHSSTNNHRGDTTHAHPKKIRPWNTCTSIKAVTGRAWLSRPSVTIILVLFNKQHFLSKWRHFRTQPLHHTLTSPPLPPPPSILQRSNPISSSLSLYNPFPPFTLLLPKSPFILCFINLEDRPGWLLEFRDWVIFSSSRPKLKKPLF